MIVAEGLYYFTQRRFDEFDMLVLEAVNAGVCVSEDDLRDRVKREIDWQYEGRPRAESPGPSMGGGVSEHILEWMTRTRLFRGSSNFIDTRTRTRSRTTALAR